MLCNEDILLKLYVFYSSKNIYIRILLKNKSKYFIYRKVLFVVKLVHVHFTGKGPIRVVIGKIGRASLGCYKI